MKSPLRARSLSRGLFLFGVFLATLSTGGAQNVANSVDSPIILVPERISGEIQDQQDFQVPDRVHLTGWVGQRSSASIANRLDKVDLDKLLEGYRHRPGRQDWIGEHAGKWLHAATLEWANSGDPELRKRMDYVARELAKCQTPDGYLGTYEDAHRWTSWDVWSHKYNLIGLITYIRYTGNMDLLPTCTRMGDLLCQTFGDKPGQRDLMNGEHMGMAPSSVLEPMVLLYRLTGEPRYLDFCKYIFRAWEQPNGPHIISTLLSAKRVDKVGDAKAYEMLSCLNGALEYYRTTGDKKVLEACLNAWQDIVDKRIYLTGSMSYREVFHDDYDLPNVSNVGETCVTVTWMQVNGQLLRLTGEARFADQLERVLLNQLLGAQLCDGSGWGYYVEMEGKKPYYKGDHPLGDTSEFTCCLSSGPRGLALVPTFAVTTDEAGVVVNLYESGQAKLNLKNGTPVEIDTDTLYPGEDSIRLTVSPKQKQAFAVKVRIPSWCHNASIQVSGQPVATDAGADGYVKIDRTWNPGDKIELNLKQEARVIIGDHTNQGKVAFTYGPLVLAVDDSLLKADKQTMDSFLIPGPDPAALAITPEHATGSANTWPGARVFLVNVVSSKDRSAATLHLIPYADAGGTGCDFKVWLPMSPNP